MPERKERGERERCSIHGKRWRERAKTNLMVFDVVAGAWSSAGGERGCVVLTQAVEREERGWLRDRKAGAAIVLVGRGDC